jgi:K+-transporting ATPase c subunit
VRGIILPAVRASLVTWVLCGIAYPVAVTGLGQLLLPFQANGSLVKATDATVLGSRLVGQQWDGPEWFHGRPSATTGTDPNDPAKTSSRPITPQIRAAQTSVRPASSWSSGYPRIAGHWKHHSRNLPVGLSPPTC